MAITRRIIGKTRYLKNIREEFKAGIQLAQIYLVVISLLLPPLLDKSSQSDYKISQIYIALSAFVFVISILIYYTIIKKLDDLDETKIILLNAFAATSGIAFSFLITIFMILHTSATYTNLSYFRLITNLTGSRNLTQFIFYIIIATLLACICSVPLLITTKKETTINNIADELINLNVKPTTFNVFEDDYNIAIGLFTLLILAFYSFFIIYAGLVIFLNFNWLHF